MTALIIMFIMYSGERVKLHKYVYMSGIIIYMLSYIQHKKKEEDENIIQYCPFSLIITNGIMKRHFLYLTPGNIFQVWFNAI